MPQNGKAFEGFCWCAGQLKRSPSDGKAYDVDVVGVYYTLKMIGLFDPKTSKAILNAMRHCLYEEVLS